MKQLFRFILFTIGFTACTGSNNSIAEEADASIDLDSIFSYMYLVHGILGNYQFTSRDNGYSFMFDADNYC